MGYNAELTGEHLARRHRPIQAGNRPPALRMNPVDMLAEYFVLG